MGESMSNLSGVAKGGVLVGVLAAVTAAVAWMGANPYLVGVAAGGLVLLGLLLLLLRALASQRRQRESEVLGENLAKNIESLSKKFLEGIKEFKKRGKDRDAIQAPWYVMVGEPGGGKTEAIKHASINLIRGMNNPDAGAGGTLNVDWWNAERAILLDTAGRLMFEERVDGQPNEWESLLNLLKSSRPNCPINGMILAIPAKTLLEDNAQKIQQKAEKIAKEFDRVQQTLGVRFPVYVLITKTDLITGFREFFYNTNSPEEQNQMLGWSNPDPLDKPFRPELVEKHLETVKERIKRRRLALLREQKVVEDETARRIDQVDALYAFPEELLRIGSRLRVYLETIFTPNEWSLKPLFLRGIYFSSAMRVGPPLDIDLATALGVQVGQIRDQRVWERDRTYFLKDVFLEKIFAEKGLVTGAVSVSGAQRKRHAAISGVTAAGALAVVIPTIVGLRTLQDGVGRHERFWSEFDKVNMDHKGTPLWYAVAADDMKGRPTYRGQDVRYGEDVNLSRFKLEPSTLERFHHENIGLAEPEADIKVPTIFQMWTLSRVTPDLQKDNRARHRMVFEEGVLRPLTDEAINYLPNDLQTLTPANAQTKIAEDKKAILSLIRLYAETDPKTGKTSSREPFELVPLIRILARDGDPDAFQGFRDLYDASRLRFSDKAEPDRIVDALDVCVDSINKYYFDSTVKSWTRLVELKKALDGYRSDEATYLASVLPTGPIKTVADYVNMRNNWGPERRAKLDADYNKFEEQTGTADATALLKLLNNAHRTQDDATSALADITRTIENIGNPPQRLADISTRVAEKKEELRRKVSGILSGKPSAEPSDAVQMKFEEEYTNVSQEISFFRRRHAALVEVWDRFLKIPDPLLKGPLEVELKNIEKANEDSRSAVSYAKAAADSSSDITRSDKDAFAACRTAADNSLRYHRFVLCNAALDGLSKPNSFATAVANNGTSGPQSLDTPHLPFVKEVGSYDRNYNPKTAQAIYEEWTGILTAIASADALDGDALKARAIQASDARKAYAKAYLGYWDSQVTTRTRPDLTGLTWESFFAQIRQISADKVNDELKKIGDRTSDAMSARFVGADFRNDPLVASAAASVAGRDQLLGPAATFRADTNRYVSAWQRLPATISEIRDVFARGKPADMVNYVVGASDQGYASSYWHEITNRGMQLLADTAEKEMKAGVGDLMRSTKFPVNLDDPPMDKRQYGDYCTRFSSLVKTPAGGWGSNIGLDAIYNKIVAGSYTQSDPDSEKIGKWKKILEFLKRSPKCTLTIPSQKEQRKLFAPFKAANNLLKLLDDNDAGVTVIDIKQKGERLDRTPKSYALGEQPFGTPCDCNTGSIDFLLFDNLATTKPHYTVTFTEDWPVHEMLRNRVAASPGQDPREVMVQIKATDKGVDYVLFVKLKFDIDPVFAE